MFRQCWKRDYQTILLVSLVAGLIPIFSPMVTQVIFSDIIPILDRKGLAMVTQVMLVVGFSTAAVSLVRNIAVLRISSHLDMTTEAALWNRLLSLPTKFFRQFQTGNLVLSRFVKQAELYPFRMGGKERKIHPLSVKVSAELLVISGLDFERVFLWHRLSPHIIRR